MGKILYTALVNNLFTKQPRISDSSTDNYGRPINDELNTLKINGTPTPNAKKLDWNSQAVRNTQNLYALDGSPATATTFFGKLAETSWNKIKNAFRF